MSAKSGVSGAIIVVVPNVMGIVIYSPRLDKLGNSARGLLFCDKLLSMFNFHHFDSLQHASEKIGRLFFFLLTETFIDNKTLHKRF